jgi:hypothetical protein
VTPVESGVTGGTELVDLAVLDAVAIVPRGWPTGLDTRAVSLKDGVTLPLLGLRLPGPPRAPVARLVAVLS